LAPSGRLELVADSVAARADARDSRTRAQAALETARAICAEVVRAVTDAQTLTTTKWA
jgi:hypothetical protein